MDDCELLDATYVRASPTSLLYFSLVKTEEGAQEILRRANQWREKYDFKVEVITFDGEVLYEFGKNRSLMWSPLNQLCSFRTLTQIMVLS